MFHGSAYCQRSETLTKVSGWSGNSSTYMYLKWQMASKTLFSLMRYWFMDGHSRLKGIPWPWHSCLQSDRALQWCSSQNYSWVSAAGNERLKCSYTETLNCSQKVLQLRTFLSKVGTSNFSSLTPLPSGATVKDPRSEEVANHFLILTKQWKTIFSRYSCCEVTAL